MLNLTLLFAIERLAKAGSDRLQFNCKTFSLNETKYVARFGGLPSQFDSINESYNQGNTIQMNACGADLGVEPGHQRDSDAQRTAAHL